MRERNCRMKSANFTAQTGRNRRNNAEMNGKRPVFARNSSRADAAFIAHPQRLRPFFFTLTGFDRLLLRGPDAGLCGLKRTVRPERLYLGVSTALSGSSPQNS